MSADAPEPSSPFVHVPEGYAVHVHAPSPLPSMRPRPDRMVVAHLGIASEAQVSDVRALVAAVREHLDALGVEKPSGTMWNRLTRWWAGEPADGARIVVDTTDMAGLFAANEPAVRRIAAGVVWTAYPDSFRGFLANRAAASELIALFRIGVPQWLVVHGVSEAAGDALARVLRHSGVAVSHATQGAALLEVARPEGHTLFAMAGAPAFPEDTTDEATDLQALLDVRAELEAGPVQRAAGVRNALLKILKGDADDAVWTDLYDRLSAKGARVRLLTDAGGGVPTMKWGEVEALPAYIDGFSVTRAAFELGMDDAGVTEMPLGELCAHARAQGYEVALNVFAPDLTAHYVRVQPAAIEALSEGRNPGAP